MPVRRAGAPLLALLWLAACGGGSDPALPDPCAAAGVCTSPPPNSCAAAASLLAYPATGTCSAVAGAASCDYQPVLTDCALAGQVCQGGACVAPPDPCAASGVCSTPPQATCSTPTRALTFPSPGLCSAVDGQASCTYPPAETDCALAGQVCQAGACVAPPDPCAVSGACTSPPPAGCDGGGRAVAYPATGTCTAVGGLASCDYPPVLTDCSLTAQVCQAGACVTPDPCVGGACTSPPPPSCATPTSATTYPASGTCTPVGGTASCDYPPIQTDCAATGRVCEAGACVTPPDPCAASGVCTTPPAPGCSLGGQRVTYPATGQCTAAGGLPSCDYPPVLLDCAAGLVCQAGACVAPPDPCAAPGVCTTPPADSCPSQTTALRHAAVGACTPSGPQAVCDYQPTLVTCGAGQVCQAGACIVDPCPLTPAGAGFLLYAAWGGVVNGYDLRAVRLDGTCDQLVVTAPGDDLSPSWDAGTGRLVWTGSRGGVGRLVTMDLHDRVERVLDTGPHLPASPTLTPDGTAVVYEDRAFRSPTSLQTTSDLFKIPFAGGAPVQLVANLDVPLQSDSGPAFAPDGQWLYFVRTVFSTSPQGVESTTILLMRASSSGTGALVLATVNTLIGRVAVSGDGTRLAYAVASTTPGSFSRIVLRSLVAVESRVLSDQGDSEPAFPAGGDRLAVRTTRHGLPEVVLLDLASGAEVQRLTTGAVAGTPAFPR
ncbi:MAG: PD40 domain-containing protein [Anaeromyxobacter sp.]|nr:PD40 domain-containing protein [Anaeromyxobacter sp.]